MRPRLGLRPRPVAVGPSTVELSLTEGGVGRVGARDEEGLARGLGFLHAHDRMLQMEMVRLAGEGRLSECLEPSAEALDVDLFVRRLGFAAKAGEQASRLTGAALSIASAYAEGVNTRLARGFPWELRLLGHRPAPWRVADSVMTLSLISFVGLLQARLDAQRFVVEALASGVDPGKLARLFSPWLDGATPDGLGLLRRVRVERPTVAGGFPFPAGLPALVASNNWVVAGRHTASGLPLAASDPHLEVNRLPAIWYEVVASLPGDFRIGVTVPGLPGLVMGRSRNVSATFTYGFMDSADLFLEEVKDGRVRRESGWVPLARRTETVLRKKAAPVVLTVHESDGATLETAPGNDTPEDGLYLASAVAPLSHGAQQSLEALVALWSAPDLDAARAAASRVSVSCNWLLADRHGRIGYQQSGLLPVRPAGLLPLPAWEPGSRWRGFAAPEALDHGEDPEEGFLVSANDDRNPAGSVAVTLSMGPERAGRIAELLRAALASGRPLVPEDLAAIQRDLLSPQARRLMPLLLPHVPDSPAGRLLSAWDLRFSADSIGATLFERVYLALLESVFGERLLGVEAFRRLSRETLLLAFFYRRFDDVLVSEEGEEWFGAGGRTGLLSRLVPLALDVDPADLLPWGETRPLVMRHLLFGGRLPLWLGFDRGPFPFPGGRATVVQGQALTLAGRPSTFAPSWRYVTDLGADEALTALAGGPSDRRFSRRYATDVERWRAFGLKTLRAEG